MVEFLFAPELRQGVVENLQLGLGEDQLQHLPDAHHDNQLKKRRLGVNWCLNSSDLLKQKFFKAELPHPVSECVLRTAFIHMHRYL